MNMLTKNQQLNSYYRFCTRFAVAIYTVFGLTGCFLFDDGTKQGFTIDGVYDGDSNSKIGNCTSTSLNRILVNYPDSVSYNNNPEAGSLRMRMPGQCFSPNTHSGWNRFDFVSPTLTDWNDAVGYSYFVKTTEVLGLHVQSLLKVRKANGDIVMKLDGSGEDNFIELTQRNQWKLIEFVRPSIEVGEEVLAIHVRVFMPEDLFTGKEVDFQLDQIVKRD